MNPVRWLRLGLFLVVLQWCSLLPAQPAGPPAVQPHAGMLRYPDVSQTHIVFAYAGDLWTVPLAGGSATPLASPPGQESFPRFSPDGQSIGFVGNYDGAKDLYTVPLAGGIPTRVTYHPAQEWLTDWTADGQLLFYMNGLTPLARQTQIFKVGPQGGLPATLPVPYGANGAISADGKWLAYTPHTTDTRTWKRYRGGMATDVWLFNLQDKSAKRVTDWEGTDTLPMWSGNTLYYLSDAGPEHRLNIWSYDLATGARQQITNHTSYDVKWPAVGPGPENKGVIVHQLGPELHLFDLTTKSPRAVTITIPGDRPTLRPKTVNLGTQITSADVSPTGKRVVVEARGELWSLPAKSGSPRALTHTSGVAERDPSWSPDGRWIAYFSDATGEYELYVTQSDGQGETKQLTKSGPGFKYNPMWSPDSKTIAYTDKAGQLFLQSVDGGDPKLIDKDPTAERVRVSWAHDSTWLAYGKALDLATSAVFLYHVPTGKTHQVTRGFFSDSWPTFDQRGDYLYFASTRKIESPIYEDSGTTFAYAGTETLLVVPLRKDVAVPFAPKSDEETFAKPAKPPEPKPAEPKAGEPKPGEAVPLKPAEAKKTLAIDVDGFEARAVLLPVKSGLFANLAVSSAGSLFYVRRLPRGVEGQAAIRMFDLIDESRAEKPVLDNAGAFAMCADGRKLLVFINGGPALLDAAAGQAPRPVPRDGVETLVDPRAEWKQVFLDSWRIERDFFYDPTLHGVNWPGIRDQYAKMLDDCTTRDDLTYILGEMFSELNVGHAYVREVKDPDEKTGQPVGLLGVDFELHEGAYRVAKIHEGAAWDADARNPLRRPEVNVNVGDYVLAVNRSPVDVSKAPWAAFLGLGNRVVTLTVSSAPKLDDKAREVTLQLLASEQDLRYRGWIERNRAYVEQKTGGKAGYLFVPNTGVDGQNDLFRQFHGQRSNPALVIDERWNAGGQIPTRFIELLNRPITNYWARRDGLDWYWPPDGHHGPKCMLINGLSGSGGDAFPAYFRKAGLGKLIGLRTWGGLVGISGNPGLIDGGVITVPTFAYYDPDGTWGIEGHGVDPDIEVIDDPSKMTDGKDPQLDSAVEHILGELTRNPFTPPKRPAYPDRKGFGIKPEDK